MGTAGTGIMRGPVMRLSGDPDKPPLTLVTPDSLSLHPPSQWNVKPTDGRSVAGSPGPPSLRTTGTAPRAGHERSELADAGGAVRDAVRCCPGSRHGIAPG